MKEEKELIEKLKEGDRGAYRQLLKQYQEKVLKTAISFVPFYEDAENIAQDVFLEVFKNIHKFRHDASISTWIYRITLNKSINYSKKNQKYFTSKSVDDYHDIYTNDSLNNNSEKLLENKELKKILYIALSQLPENQRLAFSLHKMDGFSYKEISEIMQMSLSSVESLIHRAKTGLQKKLIKLYKKNDI